MALTMPRSSTGSTSGRCRRNIKNISAVQRPNPLTAVSSLDDVFVRERFELVEAQSAVGDVRAEIPEVADLLAAQPHGSQRPVIAGGDGGRTGYDPLWEKRDEPAEDRRGRLRRQLLTDDGLDEGAQIILPLTVGQTALTDLDQPPRTGSVRIKWRRARR